MNLKGSNLPSVFAEVLDMFQCFMKNILVRNVILSYGLLESFENQVQYKQKLQEGSISLNSFSTLIK